MSKIVIETDGTLDGTSISVDGEKVENLTDAHFYLTNGECWCGQIPCVCRYVDMSYSVTEYDEESKIKKCTRYSLQRSTGTLQKTENAVDTNRPTMEAYSQM